MQRKEMKFRMKIRTILFDLDGTLIDTNTLITASFSHTFQQFGLAFTEEELLQFNGPTLIDTFSTYLPERVDEMITTYRKHNMDNHDTFVRIFPHVKSTMEKLQAAGIQIAVVTSKTRKVAQHGLEFTQLDPYVEYLVGLDDVTYAKPNPESVIKAMELLGADTETTLMVGDNYHDIEAGHSAEIRTAGVEWSHKGKEFLKKYKPTYMLADMRDILDLI